MTISVAPASAASAAGWPGVQMSSQMVSPMRALPRSSTDGVLAGLEVALLVEDAVVGQPRLAVDRVDRAAGEHRERVVDVVGALGEADQRDDALRLGRRRSASASCAACEEVLLEQQVLGRVAGSTSSGNSTSSAPASRARAMFSRTSRALPSRSPTRGSTCASASVSGASVPAKAPILSSVLPGARPRARGAAGGAGDGGELGDRGLERGGDVVEVGKRVVVGHAGRSRSGRCTT